MNKWNRHITQKEYEEVYKAGYIIDIIWIGPDEGWEYNLRRMGGIHPLSYHKSERAAYNSFKKIQKEEK